MCPSIEYLIFFFTYPGLRYDVHEPSAPPIKGKGMNKAGMFGGKAMPGMKR